MGLVKVARSSEEKKRAELEVSWRWEEQERTLGYCWAVIIGAGTSAPE